MADLFDRSDAERPERPAPAPPESGPRPLADRLRPNNLSDVVGQGHLVGEDGALSRMLATGSLGSTILWGPPGVGKTTIARLLAQESGMRFVQISAIFTGVPDLRKIFEAAALRHQNGQQTLLFVDEIHRFNKAQQDGFLPYLENGSIVLIGATTENPSFELNSALLSRAQTLVLNRLDADALEKLLVRVETVLDQPLPLTAPAREALIAMADGDGRAALSMAEQVLSWPEDEVGPTTLAERLSRRAMRYDKDGDEHYNLISALHKSVRASDPDAAIYWFARMIEGGEDPRYLARRLTRMAVEDIGLADPQAAAHCIAAWSTYERIGSPEGELALSNAVLYLALAPKSYAAYNAAKAAASTARATGTLMPPKAILNAPTGLMRDLGYGDGYNYESNFTESGADFDCFPVEMERETFYHPSNSGFEKKFSERLSTSKYKPT